MRSIILLIILSFLTYSSIFSEVPGPVRQKFERMYPYAVNAQWQTGSAGFTVIYTGVKDLKYLIKYNTAGTVVNQFRELMAFEIPSFISGNPTAYEGKKLWTEKTDSGKIKYYIQKNNSFIEIAASEKNKTNKTLSKK